MKSKLMNRRELIILGLPFLLIGAGAFVLTAREKQRIALEKQRAAQKSGPLRTVITKVNIEELTPFEVWQGYSNKVSINAELQGDQTVPMGFKVRNDIYLNSNVYLIHEKSGKTEKINVGRRIGDASDIQITDNKPLVSVLEWGPNNVRGFRTFLIRAQKLGNGPIRLQGTIRLQQMAFASYKNLALHKEWTFSDTYYKAGTTAFKSASSANFDVLINRNLDKAIDKSKPMVTESKKISLSPRSEKTGDYDGQGETQIWVRLGSIKDPAGTGRYLSVGPTDILDQHNHPVMLPKGNHLFTPNIRFSKVQTTRDGMGLLERRIPVWSIPQSYGVLTYRTWLSFGGSWPVEVTIPVRTESDLKKPDLLKLDSIRVDNGNVRVRVNYLGAYRVSTKDNNGFFDNRRYYDINDPFVLPETDEDEVESRLISNWSQHLTAPNGKEYWFENAVRVKDVITIAPGLYEIVYETNSLRVLKAGETMKFSAHVGIEGDGFIPIEAKITKGK